MKVIFVFFTALLLVNCSRIKNTFSTNSQNTSEQEVREKALGLFTGSEESLPAYLKSVSSQLSSDLSQESFGQHWYLCKEFIEKESARNACEQFLKEVQTKNSDLPFLQMYSVLLALEDAKSGKLGECSELEKKALSLKVTHANTTELQAGLKAYCENHKEESVKAFTNVIDREELNLSNLSKDYLIRLEYSAKEGYLYRKLLDYKEKYKLHEMESLLNEHKNDLPIESPVLAIIQLELNNPLNFTRYSRKLHRDDIDKYFANLRKLESCSSQACKILFSEYYRMKGDYEYIEGKYASAIQDYEKGIAVWKENSEIYIQLMEVSILQNKTSLVETYATKFRKFAPESYSRFTSLQEKKIVSKKFYSPSAKKDISILESSELNRKVVNIYQKMIRNEFLKGKLQVPVRVSVADYENAEALPDGDGVHIIIGRGLIEGIIQETAGENLAEGMIAGIIGHEIQHVLGGHLKEGCSAVDAPEYFLETGSIKKETSKERRALNWEQEYEADEMGLFYAFLSGFRGEDYLRTFEYWNRKKPLVLNGDHPPYRLRLKRLKTKIKQLHSVAESYKSAISDIQKVARLPMSKQKEAIQILESAEKKMVWSMHLMPDHYSIPVNRSYILLKSVLLADESPEMPIFPFYEASPGLGQMFRNKTEQGAWEDEKDYCKLTVIRNILSIDPYKKNRSQILAKLNRARAILEFALDKYPNNGKLWNNLAITYYLLAQVDIRTSLANPSKNFNLKKSGEYLKKAKSALEESSRKMYESEEERELNLIAMEVADMHMTGKPNSDTVDKITEKAILNAKELNLLLNSYKKQPEISTNSELVFASGKATGIWAFALGYMRTVSFYYHFKEGGRDYNSFREQLGNSLSLLSKDTNQKGIGYWERELVKVKDVIVNEKCSR